MTAFLAELRTKVVTGIVGGSDLVKQQEQIGTNAVNDVDYNFSENGLVAYKDGELVGKASFKDHVGEANLKRLLNFILHYIADLDIPVKRGTFIEFRNGMLNVSPIGRNCSREERNDFEKFDLASTPPVRATMVDVLRKEFADMDLTYSIGGQVHPSPPCCLPHMCTHRTTPLFFLALTFTHTHTRTHADLLRRVPQGLGQDVLP
jgi:phosphomannomutase